MTKHELEQMKKQNKISLETSYSEKRQLEVKKEIQRYLELCSIIETENQMHRFFEKLEIGEDGTVFSPVNEHITKSFSNTHFGLSKLLEFAFDLLKKETGNTSDFYEISFENFSNYVENAKQILNEMKYIKGDRLYKNNLGLEIYQNPKNYSIINLEEIMPITDRMLQNHYDICAVYISENYFIMFDFDDNIWKDNFISTLTPREREAFYGENAKRALGICPQRVKAKSKK